MPRRYASFFPPDFSPRGTTAFFPRALNRTEVYRQPDLRPSETGGGMAGVLTSGPSAQVASAPAGGSRPM